MIWIIDKITQLKIIIQANEGGRMLNAAEIHNSTCYFQVEFKKLNVTGMKEAVTSIVV